ncbi:MAG: glycosyltransferase family 39 protein [Opitutales bacterium]
MLQRNIIWIGWFAVMALAIWLRVNDLDARPIHFDEATGALIFSQRFEAEGYSFDPTHFHGPLLSLSTLPIAKLFGENNWHQLSLPMLRTGPLLAGLIMVLTPLLWLRTVGPRAALAAGALLASSPLLVYYNRMYIHESWVALFGMLTAAAVFFVIRQPSPKRAILAGIAAGLMFATKGTVAISLLCWTVAGLACWWILRKDWETKDPGHALTDYFGPALWFVASLLLTGLIFYGGAIIDALKSYFVYETTPGHDKSFGYYLHTMLWPKHAFGTWWSEGGIAILALLACALTLLKKRSMAVVAFVTLSVLLHILIYSLLAYKTPWLMSLPWALACLLGGFVFMKDNSSGSLGRSAVLVTFFALCLLYQTHQSLLANGRLANHADNPYAYVPTSRNITKMPEWLKKLESALGKDAVEPIAIIGQSFWPLPWYLRDFDQVSYWNQPLDGLNEFPIVISMPEQTAACNELLSETHTQLPRTLRSNVAISLYLKNDTWEAWTKPSEE